MKVKRVTPSPPGEGQRERGPGDGVSACRHRLCLGNREKARAEGGAQGDPGQRGRLGEQCGRTPRVAPLAEAPLSRCGISFVYCMTGFVEIWP